MSEFKLHALIVELIRVLDSSDPPETFINQIEKSSEPLENAAPATLLQQLAKLAPNSELFTRKYDELRSKNIDGLGSFVRVLSHISSNEELKEYLSQCVPKGDLPNLSALAAVTNDDLPKICKNIIKAAVEGEKKLNDSFSSDTKANENLRYNLHDKRPNLTWDFRTNPQLIPCEKVVPSVSQESILISDLFNCMKGINGNYIVAEPLTGPYEMRTFLIAHDVDISYKQLAQRILPLASSYSMVTRFVEEKIQPEDGQVNHALRGAIECLLKDYFLFVVQLETDHKRGKIDLPKLWFYIHPSIATMSVLSQITSSILKGEAKGGKVLSLLYEQVSDISADTNRKELCSFLIEAASVPYMQILEKWVYKGIIYDPYREFFVEDNELIQCDELPMDYSADYWEKRYTMKSERIPNFLNECAHTILRTGKYFNVIRQCGKKMNWLKQEPLVYRYRDQELFFAIDQAYSEAARTLLEVLIHENDLMGRLRSVKNYFLLAQGDFVVQFLNLCENELSKNMYDVVINRLASLLEVALRTSTADLDPYKDDLKPELLPYDLQYQMFRILSIQTNDEKDFAIHTDKTLTGIEAFVFNYDVKWPVSLVLNRKAITCYQMIFRHLFYCKHIERLLCRVWVSNKIAKTFTHEVAMAYRQAFSLRQRMLDCIQHLEYYMMVEVIEPNWRTFINKMGKVTNIDDVLSVHQDLQDSYLKECMLTDSELLSSITGICHTCIKFCNFIQESGTKSDINGSFEDTIKNLSEKFTDALLRLLNRICALRYMNNYEKLLNVFSRLDFNHFYTDIMVKKNIDKHTQ
ncbi:gamma-tubulin complex component 2-like isoform X2 [Chelonus insularis]|uniref:gamma-tubulin complex component 2-like isoform X2 n=1 Tax=Chelonus insularis TaxID=460826 RepID=UPI00158C87C3|nr:gamma-tubulin complex component 2-like isoform X2 [Chelonus insularis]